MKSIPQIDSIPRGGSAAGHREFRRNHCRIPMSGVKVLGFVRGPNKTRLVKIQPSGQDSRWIECSRVEIKNWFFNDLNRH